MHIGVGVISLLILITTVFGTDVSPKNDIEKNILNFFTHWRRGESSYLPVILPQLDVINIRPQNGNYSGKGVRINYYLSKMILTGMNNFTVAELDVSLIDMSASGTLMIPTLSIYTDYYKVDGHALYVYNLKGLGKLKACFKNIELLFEIRLANVGTHTIVNTLNLDFAIGDVQVDLENSSWPMNKVLNKEGVKIIDGYHDNIVNATQTNLIQRLDRYLNTMTPSQLLNILQTEN